MPSSASITKVRIGRCCRHRIAFLSQVGKGQPKAEKVDTCIPAAAIRNCTIPSCVPVFTLFVPLYFPESSSILQNTMNRLPTLDPNVLTIADLKEAACRDMPAMYRGSNNSANLVDLTDRKQTITTKEPWT